MGERIDESFLTALRDAVGAKGWVDDDAAEPYLIEERGLWRGTAAAIVRPAATEEVAEVVCLCAASGVPIVAHGGNTGLVGGGVPDGGVVVSLARMNRVRAIDSLNHTITVEAGCILADVQAAADEAGALFPLSLGAEGSCRIGGNLSTNAGGVAVLRYGNARDLVLGLEVVMADGRIWDGLRGLRKDNTGYDLKHLFIGAEGTLGIITGAVLKLYPKPQATETAMVATATADALLDLFSRARDRCGDALTAFEMVPRIGLDFSLRHIPDVVDPFAERHPIYGLLELTSPRPGDALRGDLEAVLSSALEDDLIVDAVIAESAAQGQALWRIREAMVEAQKPEGGSIKNDVAVPVSRIAEFLAQATAAVEAAVPGVRVVAFGHLGDGNLHFNLSQPADIDRDVFMDRWGEVNRIVHDIVVAMNGSFSAEHGIGTLKRDDLIRYKSAEEVDLMRAVKRALDPNDIMNPGKVL